MAVADGSFFSGAFEVEAALLEHADGGHEVREGLGGDAAECAIKEEFFNEDAKGFGGEALALPCRKDGVADLGFIRAFGEATEGADQGRRIDFEQHVTVP